MRNAFVLHTNRTGRLEKAFEPGVVANNRLLNHAVISCHKYWTYARQHSGIETPHWQAHVPRSECPPHDETNMSHQLPGHRNTILIMSSLIHHFNRLLQTSGTSTQCINDSQTPQLFSRHHITTRFGSAPSQTTRQQLRSGSGVGPGISFRDSDFPARGIYDSFELCLVRADVVFNVVIITVTALFAGEVRAVAATHDKPDLVRR